MSNVIGQSVTAKENRTPPVSVSNGHATSSSPLGGAYDVIRAELARVELTIEQELQSGSDEVELLLEHSRKLGGKRLRPALVLLAGRSIGEVSEGHIYAGAALEMVHLATLIHDDVLDDAQIRRHHQTAHSKFGTRQGVLLGDFLFTHSFSLAAKSKSVSVVELLAQASNLVCEGEIKQNAWQGDFSIAESAYLKMISQKTGELCAVGCGIGGILSGGSPQVVKGLQRFGRDLGVAFQIIDDVLDLVGDPSAVGKTLGTDLINRKVTLPVIHFLSSSSPSQKREFIDQLSAPEVEVESILCRLLESGSIEYARTVASEVAQRAVSFAQTLPQSQASDSLVEIGEKVLSRTR